MVRPHVDRAPGTEGETNAQGTGLPLVQGSATGASAASAACSEQVGMHSGSRRSRGGLHSCSTSASDLGHPMDLTLSMVSSTGGKHHAMQGSGELWTDEERRAYLISLHIIDLPGEEAVLRFLNDAMAGAPLPSPWKLKRDKHGNVYFANQPADVVTWSHPLEPSLRELAGAFRVCSTLTPALRKTCVYALHETWEQEAKKQFSKWYSIRHESGRAYYCNRDTGDTMWEHPAEVVLPAHYLKLTSIERLLDEAYVATTCATQTINPAPALENMRNISEITLKPESGVPSELDLVRRDLEQQLQKAVENQRLLKRQLTTAEAELRAARATNEASRRDAARAQGAQRITRRLVAQLAALEDDGREADGDSAQAESNIALPPDAKGVLAVVQEVLVARERDMAKRLEEEASLQATLSHERDAHARLGQAHLELAKERAAERRQLQGRLRESDASSEALQELLSKSNAALRVHSECAEEMTAQQQTLEQQLKEALTSKEELSRTNADLRVQTECAEKMAAHQQVLEQQLRDAVTSNEEFKEELLKSTSAIAPIEEEPSDSTVKLTDSELPCIRQALSCLQDAETAIMTLQERLAQAEESSRQKEAILRAERDECPRQPQNRDNTTAATPSGSLKAVSSVEVRPAERDLRPAAQQILESASASATLARLLRARRRSLPEEAAPQPGMETHEDSTKQHRPGCTVPQWLGLPNDMPSDYALEGPRPDDFYEYSQGPCAVKAVAPTLTQGNVAPDTQDPELRGRMLKASEELHATTVPDEVLCAKEMEAEATVKELAEAEDSFTRSDLQALDSGLAQNLQRLQVEPGDSMTRATEAEHRLAEEHRLVADIEKAENSAAQSVAARNDMQQQVAEAQERLKARELAVSLDIERRTASLHSELSEHHLRQEELQHKQEALKSSQDNLFCELQDAASLRNELQQRLRVVDIDLLKAHAREVMGNSEALAAAMPQTRNNEVAAIRPVVTGDGLQNSAVHGMVPFKAGTIQGSGTSSWFTDETQQDGSLISVLTPPRSSRLFSDKDARRARRALEDAIVLASRIKLLHAESTRTQQKIRVVQGRVQALAGEHGQDKGKPSTGGYPVLAGELDPATKSREVLPVAASQEGQDAGLLLTPPVHSSTVITSVSATPEASASVFGAVLELQAAAAVRARLAAAKEELLRLNASLNREVAALKS
mmetsp:Transcript_80200/g.158866  ORF Transcript_80200/g.158866 Transcript_80200/m.158866 type:complete len:1185 (+) Transcript_80200:123-3677(+)